MLRIELVEGPRGCLVRFSGDLVGDTSVCLWSIEPMLINEARVTLDLSGITSIDVAGLEAALRLMGAIHAFGGRLTIGRGELSATAFGSPVGESAVSRFDTGARTLGRFGVRQ
jgi:ABC-type transporter Mla MlaB component